MLSRFFPILYRGTIGHSGPIRSFPTRILPATERILLEKSRLLMLIKDIYTL